MRGVSGSACRRPTECLRRRCSACTATPWRRANSRMVARASLLGRKRPFSQRFTVPTVMPSEWANSSWVIPSWRRRWRMKSLMLSSMTSNASEPRPDTSAAASPGHRASDMPQVSCVRSSTWHGMSPSPDAVQIRAHSVRSRRYDAAGAWQNSQLTCFGPIAHGDAPCWVAFGSRSLLGALVVAVVGLAAPAVDACLGRRGRAWSSRPPPLRCWWQTDSVDRAQVSGVAEDAIRGVRRSWHTVQWMFSRRRSGGATGCGAARSRSASPSSRRWPTPGC